MSQAPTADNTYELVDLPATNEAQCADHSKMNTAENHEILRVDKTRQGRSIIGVIVAAIVAVLALVVAIAAITATVVLSQTDNSNQEIQSLKLEVGNLREMLNQTGDSLAILRTDNQARDRTNILQNLLCTCSLLIITLRFYLCVCLSVCV